MSVQSDCTCEHMCPGAVECAAVYIYDENVCHGYCVNVEAAEPATHRTALDGRIDLEVRGASLAQVGRLLAGVTDAEIFVPASRVDERRDVYLQNVSLDAAVRELHLMALVRPDAP